MTPYRRQIEFIDEPASVEVRLRGDGTVVPMAFVWRGRRYLVEAWGREGSRDRQGQSWHTYSVQTSGLETWELAQDKETAQWTLTRHWAGKHHIL